VAVKLQADWLLTVLFISAAPVGYFFFWTRRCPECGRHLTDRREMLSATAYRILSRCGRCQIDWDTGLLGDTKCDDS
jgi:hypothetical protein